ALTSDESNTVSMLRRILSSDIGIALVEDVKELEWNVPVYDVSIPDTEAFFGGCPPILLHNSHNPSEWNGIKLWNYDGTIFTRSQDREIEELMCKNEDYYASWSSIGSFRRVEGIPDMYVGAILNRIDVEAVKSRSYRVVLDCGGGAACFSSPKLLRELNCKLTTLGCEPDGFFRMRNPEPRPENLSKLMETVKFTSSDLGIAHDGDGDRTSFIDENGNYVQGDKILALICLNHLRSKPGSVIVTTVITSSVVFDVAEKIGVKVALTPVGESCVVEKMKETGAEIGGEENIGLIVRDWVWSREGIYAAALVLDIMARERRPLSQLLSELPNYEQAKLSVKCDGNIYPLIKHDVVRIVGEMLPRDYDNIITIDGIKVYYGRNWILVRPSGTEPLFRVFVEAEDKTTLEKLKKIALETTMGAIQELSEKVENRL
ncbi:phosphoglucosamine mutase, partial [Candidatus Bathyarchaeota archaeon]|nr:phosphoglucosamine mutase [Candidatus Bathyarchaeota archaeon]